MAAAHNTHKVGNVTVTQSDRKHVTGGGGGGNKEVINIQYKVTILTLSVMGFEQMEHFSRVFWWKTRKKRTK